MSTQSEMNYWQSVADSYNGGWTNSADYRAVQGGQSYQNMTSAQKAYNNLLNGGYSGFAKANGLTDYTNKLQGLLFNMRQSRFRYNPDGDALYQAYQGKFQNSANQAMRDTIGQASAKNGGYGDSFAQTAGNAAYQQQLDGLSNVQAQLLNMAYNKYANSLSNKQNAWNMYNNQNQQQYSQYQNAIGNAFNNMTYHTNQYNTDYGNAYNKWAGDRDYATSNRNYYGNTYQSELNRQQNQSIADRNFALQSMIANRSYLQNERLANQSFLNQMNQYSLLGGNNSTSNNNSTRNYSPSTGARGITTNGAWNYNVFEDHQKNLRR